MGKTYFGNKEAFVANAIVYNEKMEKIEIGESEVKLEYIIGIFPEQLDVSDFQKVTIRYKNSQYDIFYLENAGLRKLKFILEEFQNKKLEEKLLRKEKEAHYISGKESTKKILGIHHSFWILYVILILGFLSKGFGNEEPDDYSSTGEEITRETKVFERPGYVTQSEMRWKKPKYDEPKKEEFPFSFIYDVNNNKCGTLDEFSERFTYNEIRNPKVVAEFPQRPGEMVFINLKDEMFVFTDTLDRCISYQTYFLEELNKQITEDELKFSSKKFDLED